MRPATTATMTAAGRRRLAWLCLLSFALRALVPTGFMLSAAGGELDLVVCDGAVPAAHAQPDRAHHDHAHHDHAHHAGHAADASAHTTHAGHHAAGSQCPFALANGAGLAAAPPAVAPALTLTLQSAASAIAHQIAAAPPPRFRAPRGPPSPT